MAYVCLYTVLTPAPSRILRMPSTFGAANGSSRVGYAAVFGRWLAGRPATHSAKTLPCLSAVGCLGEKRDFKPPLDKSRDPPARPAERILVFFPPPPGRRVCNQGKGPRGG